MANKRTENDVVVQRPVHDSVVVIAFRGCQNALVVVSELDQVHTVSLRVVGINFVAAFQVIETNREIFAAYNQIFAVVGYVN